MTSIQLSKNKYKIGSDLKSELVKVHGDFNSFVHLISANIFSIIHGTSYVHWGIERGKINGIKRVYLFNSEFKNIEKIYNNNKCEIDLLISKYSNRIKIADDIYKNKKQCTQTTLINL